MESVFAVHWGSRRVTKLVALAVAAALGVGLLNTTGGTSSDGLVRVIIRAEAGAMSSVADLVARVGGEVDRPLRIIDAYAARVPHAGVSALEGAPEIAAVTPDARIKPLTTTWSASSDMGSLHSTARIVGARIGWNQGFTGKGVDIALIDTGVSPVPGLDKPGKLVHGPDLSFDSQDDDLRYVDGYGHGTHMAGIMAGNDTPDSTYSQLTNSSYFVGIAPRARVINVKVGAFDGSTDVSQVIAAIDWVVQNRNKNGLHIRVLNLSFGTDAMQDYRLDPLSYAAEVAWRRGIVVVAAGGNDGTTLPELSNPAHNPHLLAVGSSHPNGTLDRADDYVPDFASRSTTKRNVDVIAPGSSVVSLRVPYSVVDLQHEVARVGDRFFRGSGTSQSAAVASGFVALLLEKYPRATPEQIKSLLRSTAASLSSASGKPEQGKGLIDGEKAFKAKSLPAHKDQGFDPSSGTGSIDAARGSIRLLDENDVELRGEYDVFGGIWDGRSWSAGAWHEATWSGGYWMGVDFAGDGWIEHPSLGPVWSGRRWSGNSWSGLAWAGRRWSENSWAGRRWSEAAWSGRRWSAGSWAGRRWSWANPR